MKTDAATKRANLILLAALAAFAVALGVICFLWMQSVLRVREAGRSAQLPASFLKISLPSPCAG